MFNGNINVQEDPYFVVCARSALANVYRKIVGVKVANVQRVGSVVFAEVQASTERGLVKHQIQLDPSIYELACKRIIDAIPYAEFRECSAA